jgi:hypothetical protein
VVLVVLSLLSLERERERATKKGLERGLEKIHDDEQNLNITTLHVYRSWTIYPY